MKMDVKFEENDLSVDLGFGDVQFLKGEEGKSAYEVAVDNGFEGSEEEWLASLHGETPVKGVDYFDGKDGKDGKDGTSVSVQSVEESTDDGGSSVVTFSDGNKLTVKNGNTGADGKSAYELAVENGFEGTEKEWLTSLQGKDGVDGKSTLYVGTDLPPEGAEVWIDPSAIPSFKTETWKLTLEDETTVDKTIVRLV